jgi:phosphoenolpyruvate-protein kinase (PTS system EI component)
MDELKGFPISPGYARGWAYVYGVSLSSVPRYHIDASLADSEHRRLENAFRLSAQDLGRLQEVVEAELGRAEAEIFGAHLRLLGDDEFINRIGNLIRRERINAEWATEKTVNEAAAALAAPDNPYLRERAVDFQDLGRRVLRHLARHGSTPLVNLPAGSVLVARELFPSDLVEIDRAHLAGIVTEMGGETGHAAILARALGIPAITGVADATRLIPSGMQLLVDGVSGTVSRSPSADDSKRFDRLSLAYRSSIATTEALEALGRSTLDGVTIKIDANIGRAHEAEAVGRYQLDGVGLFRTEYLFLDETQAPTYDKHLGVLRNVVEQLGGRPLVIRTLDLGGDKLPRFLRPHHEANPSLGLRGLRFSLTSGRALFEDQIRAILQLLRIPT